MHPGQAGSRAPVGDHGEVARRHRRLVADLAARRRRLGLSQAEVAGRMGTSQPAVARLEAQAGDVRLSTLDRYAAALGARLEWWLREVADAPVAADPGQGRT